MLYDLIIIGNGPAGITASIYAARKKVSLLVIYKEKGGQVVKNLSVDNYTGYQEIPGPELVQKFEDHLSEFKFDYVEEEVEKIIRNDNVFTIKTETDNYMSRALIVATGAKPRPLNVPGEKEFENRGISYCVTCDAPLYRERDVAVVGGGNSAMRAALQLTGYANRIYVMNMDSEIKADKKLIDRVIKNPRVEIFNDTRITKIEGEEIVNKIGFILNGEENKKDVQGIFINTGYMPATELVDGLAKTNSKNEIMIDIKNRTSINGLFAAGDCTDYPYKQIIVAAGQGAAATLSAYEYLSSI
jgi:NADH-dependent peroxiredoxin subunit F